MTSKKFRSLALGLRGAVEAEHMNHPDFRVDGKIFATLNYPSDEWGMVKLKPAQQREFCKKAPEMFRPCNGVWGERGATNVHLPSAKIGVLRAALRVAWRNAVAEAK